ncbi:unnamed protein product [Toxocara canis]|uniref:BHLH domain-containing protein n=1 Tax=Toxocara canis TaxID=6265 RepID=A0A183VHK5_TOXCA|nr:unnamed protein product [Toxocara canis]
MSGYTHLSPYDSPYIRILRQIIPCYPINKKMSKQEILRGAIHYIRILEYLLGMRPTFA